MFYAVLLFPGKLHAEHAVINTISICPPWHLNIKNKFWQPLEMVDRWLLINFSPTFEWVPAILLGNL